MSAGENQSYQQQYTDTFKKYWKENYVDPEIADMDDSVLENTNEVQHYSVIDEMDDSDEDEPDHLIHQRTGISQKAARKELLKNAASRYLETDVIPSPIRAIDSDSSRDIEEFKGRLEQPDIGEWWHQQEKDNTVFKPLAKMARDVLSVIPHGVGAERSFSIGRMVVSWQQHGMTAETLKQRMIVRQDNNRRNADIHDLGAAAAAENEKIKKQADLLDQVWSKNRSTARARLRADYERSQASLSRSGKTKEKGHGYISDVEQDLDDFNYENNVSGFASFDDDGAKAFIRPGPAFENIAMLYPAKSHAEATAVPKHLPPILRLDRAPGDTDCEDEDDDSFLELLDPNDEVETYDNTEWSESEIDQDDITDPEEQTLRDRIDSALYNGDNSTVDRLRRKNYRASMIAPPVPGMRRSNRIDALNLGKRQRERTRPDSAMESENRPKRTR